MESLNACTPFPSIQLSQTNDNQQPSKDMAVNDKEDSMGDDLTQHSSNVTASQPTASKSVVDDLLDDGDDENLEHLSMVEQISRLKVKEEDGSGDRQWKNSDTAHSRESELSAVASHNGNAMFNASMDFNDSCASFATFGGSDDGSSPGLGDSFSDLAEEKAAFCKIDTDPVVAAANIRRARGRASFQPPTLQLIEENEGDL